jgi:hypothetical protein
MWVSRCCPEKHLEARNLTSRFASRPSARPLFPVEPLADLLVWLPRYDRRSFHTDLYAGRRRGVETVRPKWETPSVNRSHRK